MVVRMLESERGRAAIATLSGESGLLMSHLMQSMMLVSIDPKSDARVLVKEILPPFLKIQESLLTNSAILPIEFRDMLGDFVAKVGRFLRSLFASLSDGSKPDVESLQPAGKCYWVLEDCARQLLGTDSKNKSSASFFKPTPWIFISSVLKGLEPFRDAARDACARSRMLPVAMETWSAEHTPSADSCRIHLSKCDAVILIVGSRYGSIDSTSGVSYTENEYNLAKSTGKPIFVYFIKEQNIDVSALDVSDLSKLHKFRKRVGTDMRSDVVGTDQLETRVYQSLMEWRSKFPVLSLAN